MGIRPPPLALLRSAVERGDEDEASRLTVEYNEDFARQVKENGPMRRPFVEPVKLVKVTPRRAPPPEPELVMIMPADPYRGRIRFVARVVRPRTWRGRLRSLWRRLRVALGGKWRSRFERCEVCCKRHPRLASFIRLPPPAEKCCLREKERRRQAARPIPRLPSSRLSCSARPQGPDVRLEIEGKPVLPQEGSPEWEMLSAFFERYKL
jgi:hypothetical protein